MVPDYTRDERYGFRLVMAILETQIQIMTELMRKIEDDLSHAEMREAFGMQMQALQSAKVFLSPYAMRSSDPFSPPIQMDTPEIVH